VNISSDNGFSVKSAGSVHQFPRLRSQRRRLISHTPQAINKQAESFTKKSAPGEEGAKIRDDGVFQGPGPVRSTRAGAVIGGEEIDDEAGLAETCRRAPGVDRRGDEEEAPGRTPALLVEGARFGGILTGVPARREGDNGAGRHPEAHGGAGREGGLGYRRGRARSCAADKDEAPNFFQVKKFDRVGKAVPVSVEVEAIGGEGAEPGEPPEDNGVVIGNGKVGKGHGRFLPLVHREVMESGVRENEGQEDHGKTEVSGSRRGFQKKQGNQPRRDPDDGLGEKRGEGGKDRIHGGTWCVNLRTGALLSRQENPVLGRFSAARVFVRAHPCG